MSQKILSQKFSVQKIVVPQKVLGQKNFEFRRVMKNFEAKLPENLGVPKSAGPKELRDPKKFWSKILGSEKFWV